jgi:hypothetical protein
VPRRWWWTPPDVPDLVLARPASGRGLIAWRLVLEDGRTVDGLARTVAGARRSAARAGKNLATEKIADDFGSPRTDTRGNPPNLSPDQAERDES